MKPPTYQSRQLSEAELGLAFEDLVDWLTMQAALTKWVDDLAAARCDSPLKWEHGRFEETTINRNLVKSKNEYGRIANACGVSYQVLEEMLENDRKPRSEQWRRICIGLLEAGRLHLRPPPIIAAPREKSATELRDRLEEITFSTARWKGPDSLITHSAGASILDRLPGDDHCNDLCRDARGAGDFAIANAAIVLKACRRIKAGIHGLFMSTSWDIVAELEAVRATEPDAGLRSAATVVQARLLRELALGGRTPILKALILDRAARIMGSLDGERAMPFRLIIPGLPSESNRERTELTWLKDSDPLTTVVPHPLRYQANFAMDVAFQQWLIDPSDRARIERWLDFAEQRATEGLGKNWDHDQPLLNLASAKIYIACLRLMFLKSDGHGIAKTRTALNLAHQIDGLIGKLESSRFVGEDKRDAFGAAYYSCLAFVTQDGEKQDKALSEALVRIRGIHLNRPEVKSITVQDSVFRYLFMANSERRKRFLNACRFTDQEIAEYSPYLTDSLRWRTPFFRT